MSKTTNAHVDLFAFADTVCDLADVGAVVMGDINFASKVYGKLTKSGPSLLSAIGEFAGMGDDYTPDYFAGVEAASAPATSSTPVPPTVDPKRLDKLIGRVDDLIRVSDAWLNSMHPLTRSVDITAVKEAVKTAKQFQKQLHVGMAKAKTDAAYLPKWIDLGNAIASGLHTCPDALIQDSTIAERMKLLFDDLIDFADHFVLHPGDVYRTYRNGAQVVKEELEKGREKLKEGAQDVLIFVMRAGATGLASLVSFFVLDALFAGKAVEAKMAESRALATTGFHKGLNPMVWEAAEYTVAPLVGVGLGIATWQLFSKERAAKLITKKGA